MKVTFKNNSSSGIAYMGHPLVEIPGHATVTLNLPDGERTRRVLGYLRRRYKTLDIEIDNEEGDEAPSVVACPVEPENNPMPLDEFAAMAQVKEGGSGWCSVTVEGIEKPFKVRVPKDGSKTATELAYAEYAGKGE